MTERPLYRVLRPSAGLKPGDHLTPDPDNPLQLIRWRPKRLKNPVTLREALACGDVEMVTPVSGEPEELGHQGLEHSGSSETPSVPAHQGRTQWKRRRRGVPPITE